MNRALNHPYALALQNQAEDLVADEAYEEATDAGWIFMHGATRMEPGYWSDTLDIDVEDLHVPAADDEEAIGDLVARVVVKLRSATLFTGTYGFHITHSGRLAIQDTQED